MQLDDETATRCVDAGLRLHGLMIDPSWRDAVAGNFKAVANAAALVSSFPLNDELDPGPIFTP